MNYAKELTQTYSTWSDLGYKGEGMVISIIDTGIDYNHKDLVISDPSKAKLTSKNPEGLGKYYTDKVPYGYNFADCNDDVIDSNESTGMHGMHVAGIAAANGKQEDTSSFKAIQGVAPEAQLLDMKVFSNDPSALGAYSDDIIAAIEDSVLHGADVINMSLGSDSGFTDPEDPQQVAVKNAVDQGVVVVTAAGNSSVSTGDIDDPVPQKNLLGTVDTGTVGDPSTASDAISVACFENNNITTSALEYISKAEDNSGSISYIKTANDLKIKFNGKQVADANKYANDMSYFSSWGPTPSLDFKPEVTAPGGNIYSLANNNSYQSMSGTSMASPSTAGGEALIVQGIKAKNLGISESVDKSTSIINEYSIPNASMSFDKNTVTVPSNGDAKVDVTIVLPDDFNKQQYVEGFIKFVSNDNNVPSLNVPYMAFYGDWSAVQNIDKPSWQADSLTTPAFSNFMSSALSIGLGTEVKVNAQSGTELLTISGDAILPCGLLPSDKVDPETIKPGQTLNLRSIDPSKIAFSPNKDNSNDIVITELYQLRSVKNIKVDIFDANKNVIRTLENGINVRKNLLPNSMVMGYFMGIMGTPNYFWDGTLYDSSTGKYITAPEGQYNIRITSKADMLNAKEQIIEMPVKIDVTAPEVKIISKSLVGDSTCLVQWTETDNIDGVGINPSVNAIFIDGQPVDESNSEPISFDDATKTYSCKVKVKQDSNNLIEIGTLDYAGNMGMDNGYVEKESLNPVAFYNLSDGIKLNNKNFTISGKVKDNVKTLIINDSNVTIENSLNFTQNIELQYGANQIKVQALDADNKELYNKTYDVGCDNVAPVILITKPSVDSDGLIFTDDYNITLSGKITEDNISKFTINSEEADVDANGNFTKSIDTKFNNGIEIQATDEYGNATNTFIIAIYKGESSIVFENFGSNMLLTQESGKDDTYLITGYATKPTKVFTINDSPVTVNSDLSFSYLLKLNQGKNMVKVYAVDEENKVLLDKEYKVTLANKAPDLIMSNPSINADGKIYTNQDSLNLTGQTVSRGYDYSLYINGNSVMRVVNSTVDSKKDFSYTVPVKDGDKLNFLLADDLRNVSEKNIEVVVDKISPKTPTITLDNTKQIATINCDQADKDILNIEYSFDNKTWVKYTEPFNISKNTKVYARLIDFASNYSEISTLDVNTVDKTPPVITIDGVVDGGSYNDKVNIKISVNEGNYSATLDGQEYTGAEITTAGNHKLIVTAKDEANNLSEKTMNFVIVASTTIPNTSGGDTNVTGDSNNNTVDKKAVATSDNTMNISLLIMIGGTGFVVFASMIILGRRGKNLRKKKSTL